MSCHFDSRCDWFQFVNLMWQSHGRLHKTNHVLFMRYSAKLFFFKSWFFPTLNCCHMTAAATLIAATIASCKRRARGLTKPHVTIVLRLSSGMPSCLYSLHVMQAYRPIYEVSCHILHYSPRSYLLTTWFGFVIAAYFNLWCRGMFCFVCQQYMFTLDVVD